MTQTAISVKNLSKEYRLGTINHGTLYKDIQSWWARLSGKVDPNSLISGQGVKGGGQVISSAPNSPVSSRFLALDDVSFEVQQGDVIGIIGRNGAGKSTLLKILSQVTTPTSGVVKLKGRVASLLEVGTGFHQELTGRENVFLNGAILGMSKAEIRAKFDEIVDFAEIDKFIDTPVKRYSSGMYVRLAFAVAAHMEPEILILDEVLAVGDAQFQKKCLGKMEEVGREGRTIVFVSHNMTAIRTLCTRAIVLSKGVLLAEGSTQDAIDTYLEHNAKRRTDIEWKSDLTAPGNEAIVFRKISVCYDDGMPANSIYSDMPFNIEIDYAVRVAGFSVCINLVFYDSNDNCILASINNHECNWYGKQMQIGEYKSICNIPKNIFNEGVFSVSVMILGKNYTDPLVLDKVLRIEILDGTEVRGDYFGAYACPIRPLFPWYTQKKES